MIPREEHIIIRGFTHLRDQKPDPTFAARTRHLVLAARPSRSETLWGIPAVWRRAFLGTAVGVGGFLLITFIHIFSPTNELTLSNEEKLLREAQTVEFQIQLGEARYFEESAAVVSMALEKISTPQSSLPHEPAAGETFE